MHIFEIPSKNGFTGIFPAKPFSFAYVPKTAYIQMQMRRRTVPIRRNKV